MTGSGQKDEGKKKITEVKTFPAPFALGEIKEKITIENPVISLFFLLGSIEWE